MILYDIKLDKIIGIDKHNLDFEHVQSGSNSIRGFTPTSFVHNEYCLKLVLGYNEFDYIKYWFNEGQARYTSEYKRNIFILEDMSNYSGKKFSGCFIKNINTDYFYNIIKVEIGVDYFEIGEFNELKSFIRDKKLEEILK
jgi:hypothetical protein